MSALVEERTLGAIRMLADELRDREMETAKARARLEQAVRSAEGISQLRLAEAAGVSRQRIQQVLAK